MTAPEPRAATGVEGSAPPRSALRDPGAHVRFWLVAVAGLALDLWSKEWAFHALRQGGRRVLIPRVLELQTMLNDGALFGIGSGQTVLFLVASALALGLVLWMFSQSTARHRLLHIALGGILAGALGNMYDRMFVQLLPWRPPGGTPRYFVKSADGGPVVLREYPPRADGRAWQEPAFVAAELPAAVGHVRDFVKIPTRIGGKRELWPWVFNVADMLLVVGVGILALRLWFDRGSHTRRKAKLDSEAGTA